MRSNSWRKYRPNNSLYTRRWSPHWAADSTTHRTAPPIPRLVPRSMSVQSSSYGPFTGSKPSKARTYASLLPADERVAADRYCRLGAHRRAHLGLRVQDGARRTPVAAYRHAAATAPAAYRDDHRFRCHAAAKRHGDREEL